MLDAVTAEAKRPKKGLVMVVLVVDLKMPLSAFQIPKISDSVVPAVGAEVCAPPW